MLFYDHIYVKLSSNLSSNVNKNFSILLWRNIGFLSRCLTVYVRQKNKLVKTICFTSGFLPLLHHLFWPLDAIYWSDLWCHIKFRASTKVFILCHFECDMPNNSYRSSIIMLSFCPHPSRQIDLDSGICCAWNQTLIGSFSALFFILA